MANLYTSWTLEQDRLLHQNRHESLPRLASKLGRGLNGVTSRLKKISDVDSAAYRRLFVDGNHPKNSNNNNDDDDDKSSSKLTPVKEVLRRIQWDSALLDPVDFTVSYFDRVLDKVLVTPYDAPNTSVKGPSEYFVLAIPEHRITAVHYRERIVWDREARLDRVFGSGVTKNTGDGDDSTIDKVVENYPQWKKSRDEEEDRNRQRQQQVTRQIKMLLSNNDAYYVALKQRSKSLLAKSSDDDDVREYVSFVLKLFRDAYAPPDNIVNDTEDRDNNDTTFVRYQLECMELFSELVALLPNNNLQLRERVLSRVESVVARLEGKTNSNNTKATASSELPQLNEDDLEEKFVRGSGAGGQKVNKTSNRVVLLHVPSNIRVECQETRSLQQNRKIARKRLRLKLDEHVNGKDSRASVKATKLANKKAKAKNRSRRKNSSK